MSREELVEYVGHLKRMIDGLQKQLTKALETIVQLKSALMTAKENQPNHLSE